MENSHRGVSLDISLYPMTPDYKKPILAFIEALRQYEGFTIKTNPLSTQLYGDFTAIWHALERELPLAFGQEYTNIVVMKLVSINVEE